MKKNRVQALQSRHRRVRRRVIGVTERPRLCVHKSLRHMNAQIIDDSTGQSLCQVSTNTKARKAEAKSFRNKKWAKALGEELAAKALEKGITRVVFDRGGFKYHGCVRELAEAVRAAGVQI